jgi:hypothetical protein
MAAVATAPQVAPATQQAPQGGLIPFPAASRPVINGATLQWNGITPGASPQYLGPSDFVPTGYIRQIEIAVSTTTAGTIGSGTVGADFPFNLFQNLQFIDAGGQKMDDLPGFALLIDNIWGGFRAISDPRLDYDYSANPISPNFRLRLEREMFPDGRGCLPNLSGTQKYRFRAVIDAITNIYTVSPTTAPTLLITINQHEWFLPEDYNGAGQAQETEPALMGLAQYRTSWYPAISIGNAQVNEQVKANGNLIKYIAMIARNTSGVRTDAVFPNPLTLRVDNSYPINNVPLPTLISTYQSKVRQAAQRDTGVLVIPYDTGLGRAVGDNGFASLEQTSTATWIQLTGLQPTPTVGTIDFLVCEVSVAEVDPAQRSALGSATGTWNPQIAPTVMGGV